MKRFESAISNEMKDLENVEKKKKFKSQSAFCSVSNTKQSSFLISQISDLPPDFKYFEMNFPQVLLFSLFVIYAET